MNSYKDLIRYLEPVFTHFDFIKNQSGEITLCITSSSSFMIEVIDNLQILIKEYKHNILQCTHSTSREKSRMHIMGSTDFSSIFSGKPVYSINFYFNKETSLQMLNDGFYW